MVLGKKRYFGLDDPSLVNDVRGKDPFSKYERVKMENSQGLTVVQVKHSTDGRLYSLKSVKIKTHKIFDKKKKEQRQKQEEEARSSVNSLKKIDHPNIIRLYDIMEYGSKLYLIEELHVGKHWQVLSSFKGKLGEEGVCSAVKQLLSAVNYLEEKNFTHGRMSLQGIMVDTNKAFIMITDFLGTFSNEDEEVEMVSDVYSIGAMAYELVTCKRLKGYKVNKKQEQFKALSKNGQLCIQAMIYQQAMTPRQALDHPWIDEKGGENFLKHFKKVTKAFETSSKSADIKRAAMNVIARHSSPEDLAHLLQAFREFDGDNSGTISSEEFHIIMKKLGKRLPKAEIDKIYEGIDVDGDGTIGYTEFVAGALEFRGQIEEWKVRSAFLEMDRDHSGYITHEELRSMFSSSEEDAQRMIEESDTDKDGQSKWSIVEYLDYYTSSHLTFCHLRFCFVLVWVY